MGYPSVPVTVPIHSWGRHPTSGSWRGVNSPLLKCVFPVRGTRKKFSRKQLVVSRESERQKKTLLFFEPRFLIQTKKQSREQSSTPQQSPRTAPHKRLLSISLPLERTSNASCRAAETPTRCTLSTTSQAPASEIAKTPPCLTSTTRTAGKQPGPPTVGFFPIPVHL